MKMTELAFRMKSAACTLLLAVALTTPAAADESKSQSSLANADHIVALLTAQGFASEIWQAGGAPYIYAELDNPGASFNPEWRLYARSAGDDKMPIIALKHTLTALREHGIPLPVNLKLLRGIRPDLIVTPTMGGSLPLHEFGSRIAAPIIILPLANHDNNQHAENENIRPQNIWDAMGVYGAVLAAFGR